MDGPDQVNEGIFLQYNVSRMQQDLPANQYLSNQCHTQTSVLYS